MIWARRDLVLEFRHPALDEGLAVLGGVVFGVLREIAMLRASAIAWITVGRSTVLRRFSSASRA